MTRGKTIRITQQVRVWLCLLIVVSLNGRAFAVSSPSHDRRAEVSILAGITHSPGAQINSGNRRFENANHRNTVDPALILPAFVNQIPGREQSVMPAGERFGSSVLLDRHRSGRSPPR